MYVLIIALAVLSCWVWTFRGRGHDWGGDFSLYIAHARNIATGHPYAAVNYIPEKVIEKDIPPHGPPTYPPVFPLLLAPVYGVFGLAYGPMRAFVQVLWMLAGVLFYAYGRSRGLSPLASAATVAVFLLSSMVLNLKNSVLSESTYLVVCAAALLFFEWIYRRGEALPRPWLYGILTGLLLLTAYFTRVTGITLVAAFGLHELYRMRRIRTFAVMAAAVFLTGFGIYRLTLYDGAGYSAQFRITPHTWASNAEDYIKSPAALWGSMPAPLRYPAALFTIALAVAGLVRRFRSGPSVAEFYVVLYIIPLLLYSSGANNRYILPLYPLVLLYCTETLIWLRGMMPEGSRRPAFAALALVLVAGVTANVNAAARQPEPDGPEKPSFQEMVAWIRKNTGPSDVIVSWNPRVVALYTERPSAFYRPTDDQVLFGQYLASLHTRWVLVFHRSQTDARWMSRYVQNHPDHFAPAWRNKDFTLYRLLER